jgi:hypothetical protein
LRSERDADQPQEIAMKNMSKTTKTTKTNYPTSVGPDKDWQSEQDANTLHLAAEIKGDKKRMAAAMKCLMDKAEAMNSAVAEHKGAKYPKNASDMGEME